MFESETEKESEQKRSYLLMSLGAIGALLLAVVVIFLGSKNPRPQEAATANRLPGGMQNKLEGALRAGSAEYDSYLPKVVLEKIEIQAAGNMLGMTRLVTKGRLHNRGDRAITGIELTAVAYNLENKVAAQNTSQPIPNKRTEPLKPGESIPVETVVDLPANIREGDIMDVKQSISGLKFQ